MNITGLAAGIIAIIFGILVLAFPRILNYLVAIFLIIAGAIAIYQALV
jgi:uncharacterized membrane protein HdeD (DUF308 family)